MLQITTPAVLFSTVSLLMAAYLSRFANLARLMRNLAQQEDEAQEYVNHQLAIFCQRITYIKYLQFCGILSLLFSTGAMFLLLLQFSLAAQVSFGIALFLFLFTLLIGGIDVYYSMQALSIKLKDEVEL